MANIQERGEGTYFFTVSLGKGSDGKYKRKTKTFKVEEKLTPKKEMELVEEEYIKFKREVLSGEHIAPSRNSKMTFAKFVDEWLKKHATDNIRPTTLRRYEISLRTRLLPEFGHMYLDEITFAKIEDFLYRISKDGARQDGKKGGLSKGSIDQQLRVLKSIFKYAKTRKMIKNVPTIGLIIKIDDKKENEPYDSKEIDLLLQALQNEPLHWRTFIMIALDTGMRRGELLALEWKHIDWENGIISIEQNISLSKNGVPIISAPKTKNGKRKIALMNSTLEILKDYREAQLKEQSVVEWKGGDRRFVFCHPNGEAYHQERPYQWFRRFLKRHNLRNIRFHDLRHTSATMMISQGIHAKIISSRLGHGDIGTTMNIYGHALQEADKVSVNKMENVYNFKKYNKKPI